MLVIKATVGAFNANNLEMEQGIMAAEKKTHRSLSRPVRRANMAAWKRCGNHQSLAEPRFRGFALDHG